MLRRCVLGATVALAAALSLAACVPTAAPSTPTPTAPGESVFDDARDVLDAYTAAVNQIDVSDPATFEPAFALSTGKQNQDDRQTYGAWHAAGWTQRGEALVVRADDGVASDDGLMVTLLVCLDLSSVQIWDAQGESQVVPGRPEIQPLTAYLERESARDAFLVANLQSRNGEPSCS